jgi:phage terminase small subunit
MMPLTYAVFGGGDCGMANGLTTKQEVFVRAYIGEAKFNATKAARMAGYSESSAYQRGYELVKNSDIRARIDEMLDEMTLTAKETLTELTDVATAEWRDFVEILSWDAEGKPLKVKMDLGSKVKSLELLGKHHQLFSDNLNISGGIELHEFVGIPKDAP